MVVEVEVVARLAVLVGEEHHFRAVDVACAAAHRHEVGGVEPEPAGAGVIPEGLEAQRVEVERLVAVPAMVGMQRATVRLSRVLRRIRQTRTERYRLLRGFFYGRSDRDDDEEIQPRLHSVWLTRGAAAIGMTLNQLHLAQLGCEVSAIRRRG